MAVLNLLAAVLGYAVILIGGAFLLVVYGLDRWQETRSYRLVADLHPIGRLKACGAWILKGPRYVGEADTRPAWLVAALAYVRTKITGYRASM